MARMTPEEFVRDATGWGYVNPVVLPDGRYAAVYERPYNSVILVNIDRTGYSDQF